ncbi:FKBP-type peptidyl-prolyl cis-trans isomerase [Candidatus Nomurabacteria bacterium]|nr:FKBP-type peptidyl-prolyl cis-trans isomerase [Candidatus Nomurabacteria bacterium]
MENKKMNIVLAVVICLVLIGAIVFISIKNKPNMAVNNNTNNSVNNVADNATPTPAPTGQVPEGSAPLGTVAKTGDTVAMNYTGRLADGTVFDSNVDPKFKHVQPFIFTLGAGQVIPGWDKGIVGMKVGEKKTLVIAPADGYGAAGAGGVIPPNATLTFEVELLGIKK